MEVIAAARRRFARFSEERGRTIRHHASVIGYGIATGKESIDLMLTQTH
jgi:hypothetical protein